MLRDDVLACGERVLGLLRRYVLEIPLLETTFSLRNRLVLIRLVIRGNAPANTVLEHAP